MACLSQEQIDAIVAAATASLDIPIDNLTQGVIEGSGVFDVLMRAMKLHLEIEHRQSRITGDQYATVYVGALTAVLQQSVAFLLGRENIKLQAQLNALQLAKLQAEIMLLCQKLVTEKSQVMDSTILDPTASIETSAVGDDGNSLFNSVQPIAGATGYRNDVLARQVKGYDDNYKTNVGKAVIDAWKTVISNLGSEEGDSFPQSIQDAGVDYIMRTMKMDAGLQPHDITNADINYQTLDPPVPTPFVP